MSKAQNQADMRSVLASDSRQSQGWRWKVLQGRDRTRRALCRDDLPWLPRPVVAELQKAMTDPGSSLALAVLARSDLQAGFSCACFL